MKIRKAKRRELKEISELFLTESAKKPFSQGYDFQTANKRISDMFTKGIIYVAIIDKKIAGFLSTAGEGKKEIYLDEFWIKEEYQRKGFGKSLLKFVEEESLEEGIKTISVMTSRKAGAFKFYKKLNYKVAPKEVILSKKL